MKNAVLLLIAASGLIGLSAQAGPHRSTDYARVTKVEPIYETVRHSIPEETCWTETVREISPQSNAHSATPTLIGGILGGVIGNEVGKGGDNKKIGAVVGSILGISIARDIQKQHRTRDHSNEVRYRDVERCEVNERVEIEQVLSGYNVTYRYFNKSYQTFMQEHPGEKLRVAVNVRPL